MGSVRLTEEQFEGELSNLLLDSEYEFCTPPLDGDGQADSIIEDVSTYQEEGWLTGNRGLVLRLSNGQKFHLTITEQD